MKKLENNIRNVEKVVDYYIISILVCVSWAISSLIANKKNKATKECIYQKMWKILCSLGQFLEAKAIQGNCWQQLEKAEILGRYNKTRRLWIYQIQEKQRNAVTCLTNLCNWREWQISLSDTIKIKQKCCIVFHPNPQKH